MVPNTSKCNCLTPLHFKGLITRHSVQQQTTINTVELMYKSQRWNALKTTSDGRKSSTQPHCWQPTMGQDGTAKTKKSSKKTTLKRVNGLKVII